MSEPISAEMVLKNREYVGENGAVFDDVRFYADKGGDLLKMMYYNPDGDRGGQIVENSIHIDALAEAFRECKTGDEFWERLDERARQCLTDIDAPEFAETAKEFVERPCDFQGQSLRTMEGIRGWAALRQAELEMKDTAKIPIYPHSVAYAKEHGEIGAYRESMDATHNCMQAIDRAVHDFYLGDYRYDLKSAAETVIGECGMERLNFVLANILLNHDYDKRYSRENQEWARGFGITPDRYVYCDTHPAVLDGFISTVCGAHREILVDAIGRYEQSHRMTERNRLTWFNSDFGIYRANPAVSHARLMARYNEIMEKNLEREHRRSGAAAPENVHGYEIKKSVCFSNDRGFALAHNSAAVSPFVTWQFTEESGKRDYYWGHYFAKGESAARDFGKRVREYRTDYPTLTEKPANYLQNAEMSVEQNYNMLDGAINNLPPEPEKRPSAVEKLEAAKKSVKPPAPGKAAAKPEPER